MNEDLVIQKLLEHDSKIDEMLYELSNNVVKKSDISILIESQDEIMKILKRLDEERIFTNEHFKRVDNRLDANEEKTETIEKRVDKIELQFQPT